MKFRLKAFSMHLAASVCALGLVVGTLYLGWYHWPGWYLANATLVLRIMIGVDVVLGPLLTLIIASPAKPRSALKRDIAVIAMVQLVAFVYGSVQLWNGRPLYYAFSGNCLSLVQAYDIDGDSRHKALEQQSSLAPHWYSLPRWIWAPQPENAALPASIDPTAAPQYYQSWQQGLAALRAQLKTLDDSRFFLPAERRRLKQRMREAGISDDQPDTLPLTGRARPLLAIFDLKTLQLKALIDPT